MCVCVCVIKGISTILPGKTIEDIINEWAVELEDQAALFTKQAIAVSNYDRMLVENADKVIRSRLFRSLVCSALSFVPLSRLFRSLVCSALSFVRSLRLTSDLRITYGSTSSSIGAGGA